MRWIVLAVLAGCSEPRPAVPASSGPSTTAAATPSTPPASPAVAAEWPVPEGWRGEVIRFPLDFAPELAHTGYEDLRFPPGFFDPTSTEYWSYAFIWRTGDPADLDAVALGRELTTYFRGLIATVDVRRRIPAIDQIVATATRNGAQFKLTAHVFDAFKTAAPVDLVGVAARRACDTGALWSFVLAPAASTLRPQLDALAAAATCR